jgi:hypothetical protein
MVVSIEDKGDRPHTPHGPLRKMLKLIVESDNSRFLGNRIGASLLLLGILALFAVAGYALPALFSRFF